MTHTQQQKTIRFTVDLDREMHQGLSELAKQKRSSKVNLVRGAIGQLQLGTIEKVPPPETNTVRFTVDLASTMHQQLSLLAVWQQCKKADLVRGAIGRLLATERKRQD